MPQGPPHRHTLAASSTVNFSKSLASPEVLGQVSYRNFRRLQGAGGTKSTGGVSSVQNRARYADLPHQPGFAGLRTYYYNTVLEGVLATCGGKLSTRHVANP